MRQARTRILSLLLALVMCLSLLPASAMAEEAGVGDPAAAGDTGDEQQSPEDTGEYTVVFWVAKRSGEFQEPIRRRTQNVGGDHLVVDWPADPVMEGGEDDFVFVGWSRERPGSSDSIDYVTSNENFTEDIALHAVFKPVPAVTFDPNGGTCEVTARRLADGVLEGPLPTPVRAGFTFEGWYRGYKSASDPGKKIEAGEYFSDAETVTAVWRPDGTVSQGPVRVDFFPNGGRITVFNGVQVPPLTPGTPPFYLEDGSGVDQNSGIGWLITDGDGRLSSLPAAVREGYSFGGWYKLPDDVDFWDAVGGNESGEVFTDLTGQPLTVSAAQTEGAIYAAKWTKLSDVCTITFRYVNAPGTPPEPVQVPKGSPITLPEVELKGYRLRFWVSGTLEDNQLTIAEEWTDGKAVTGDVTLYACWEAIPSTEDTYDFGNDTSAFADYRITDTYFDYLTDSTPWKSDLIDEFLDEDVTWGGSCFGMSAVYCMARGGAIDLGVFQSGASTLRALKTPRQSQNIQDLINFYMMAQSTAAGARGKSAYLDLAPDKRYRQIVSDLTKETGFSVLGFNYSQGGHAIVARSVEQRSDGYHIEIWDPNHPEGLGELVISSNFSSAAFTSDTYNAGNYNRGTLLKYIMPLSTRSRTYDAKNLQAVFGGEGSSSSGSAGLCLLSSSTGDFTVTAADGRSAVVKGGQQVSGDLKLLDGTIDGGPGGGYRFYIEAAGLGEVTIALDGKTSEVKFVSDDAMAKVSADRLNRVVIDGAQVTTACAGVSRQEITLVSDRLGSTWNKVTVTGEDTGLTLRAEAGQLTVISGGDVSVTVRGENVDSGAASSARTVDASPSGAAVTMDKLDAGAQQPVQPANPFTDVREGSWFYDAVMYVYRNRLMTGVSDTSFAPNTPMTRAMLVTVLYRIDGSPAADGSISFADVAPGKWYSDAIAWAAANEIVGGYSTTQFGAGDNITREQIAAILYRYAKYKGYDVSASGDLSAFSDRASVHTFAADALQWAVGAGLMQGSGTNLNPRNAATRAEVATILKNFQEKFVKQ